MKRDKLIGLQILRGIAAWLVVMHHVNQIYFDWNPPLLILSVFNFGYFGIDIFFVLSGFIMYYSAKNNNKGGGAFFVDRFFRIFPAYWLMTILLLASYLLIPETSYKTSFTAETLLKSFFLIPHENPGGFGKFPFLPVGWTLTYEMFFYIVLSISLMIRKRHALIIATLFLSALPFLLGHYNLLGSSNFFLIEFVTGIIIAHLYTPISSNKYFKKYQHPKFSIVLFISINIICFVTISKLDFLIARIICASLIVFIFLFIEDILKSRRVLNKLILSGDISYSIYLIHPIILGWFHKIFFNSDSLIFKYIIIVIFLCLVYYLSLLSYRYIETNKWLYNKKEKLKNINLINSKFINKNKS